MIWDSGIIHSKDEEIATVLNSAVRRFLKARGEFKNVFYMIYF